MASKPKIQNVVAFDATKDYDLEFSWNGSVCHGSKAKFVNNKSEKSQIPIYSTTYPSMLLKNTITANTLQNGNEYKTNIVVYDVNENEISDYSDTAILHCYSTPTFVISNKSDNINSSAFEASITYDQQEGLEMQSYIFYLYDNKGELLDKSDYFYSLDSSYVFDGFSNMTYYKIRCVGITVYGMEVSDEFTFYVKYERPTIYYGAAGTVDETNGNILLNVNVTPLKYGSSDNLSFIDGEIIDLTKGGSFVSYGSFHVPDEFLLQVNLLDRDYEGDLICLGNNKYGTKVIISQKKYIPSIYTELSEITDGSFVYNGKNYIKTYDTANTLTYYEVRGGNNSGTNMLVYSNRVSFEDNQQIYIYLKCKNGLYSIYIQKKEES